MAQHTWIYKNKAQISYEVSVYHGQRSGHVLVYSQRDIIVIDFSVLKTKAYNFYLGEEWFELKLNIKEEEIVFQLFNVITGKEIKDFGEANYPVRHILKALLLVLGIILFVWLMYAVLYV